MVWWIPMAVSAASSIYGAASSNAQNAKQQEWNKYNANMKYNSDMMNVGMQMSLGKMNSQMQIQQSLIEQQAIKETTELNANIIRSTALYNDALYEEEITQLWDSVGLDLQQLEGQRATERGTLVANQGASGTVIGEESNADVIVHQKTQEAMDAFIVKHGADKQAAQISNARAQSLWNADMQIKKTLYEGNVNMTVSAANAEMQANANMMSTGMGAISGIYNARQGLDAGIQGAQMTADMNSQKTGATFASGMFGAASQGTQSYFQQKSVTSLAGSGTSLIGSGSSSNYAVNYNMDTGFKPLA